MRSFLVLFVVVVVPVQAIPTRALAQPRVDPLLLEDARAAGHLLADDDLAADRGWSTLPGSLPGGSLGFTTGFSLFRTATPEGSDVAFRVDLAVQIPLDRLLFGGARVVPHSRPVFVPFDQEDSDMKSRHWGARAVLPSALTVAGAIISASPARAKDKTAAPPSSSASAAPSASATIVVGAAPSVAGLAVVTGPLTPSPLRADVIARLVSAAIRHAGLDRDEALTDLASRARASALAPEVRLRAYRGIDVGARIYRTDDLADKATTSDAAQTLFEARLSWRLDRAVFADEEVAIERIRLERADLKQKVTMRVIEFLLKWQRARRASSDPNLLDAERDEAAVVALETLLALDAITGGAASVLLLRPAP